MLSMGTGWQTIPLRGGGGEDSPRDSTPKCFLPMSSAEWPAGNAAENSGLDVTLWAGRALSCRSEDRVLSQVTVCPQAAAGTGSLLHSRLNEDTLSFTASAHGSEKLNCRTLQVRGFKSNELHKNQVSEFSKL